MLAHGECRLATIDHVTCNYDLGLCFITSRGLIGDHIVSIVMLKTMNSTGFRPREELNEYIDLARQFEITTF